MENDVGGIVARFVRIRPRGWHGHICMRVEFYGCRAGKLTIKDLSPPQRFPEVFQGGSAGEQARAINILEDWEREW